MAECGEDSRTRLLFEEAIALDGLHLHLLEAPDARTARRILLKVASGAARSELPRVEVEGRVLDENSQQEFRDKANDLVGLLRPENEQLGR